MPSVQKKGQNGELPPTRSEYGGSYGNLGVQRGMTSIPALASSSFNAYGISTAGNVSRPTDIDDEVDEVLGLVYNLLDMMDYFYKILEEGEIDPKDIDGLKIRLSTTVKTYETLSERYFKDDAENEEVKKMFKDLMKEIAGMKTGAVSSESTAPADDENDESELTPATAAPVDKAPAEKAPAPKTNAPPQKPAQAPPADDEDKAPADAEDNSDDESDEKDDTNDSEKEPEPNDEEDEDAEKERLKKSIGSLRNIINGNEMKVKFQVYADIEKKHDHGRHDQLDHDGPVPKHGTGGAKPVHERAGTSKAGKVSKKPVEPEDNENDTEDPTQATAQKVALSDGMQDGLVHTGHAITNAIRKTTEHLFGTHDERAAAKTERANAGGDKDDKKLGELQQKGAALAKEIWQSNVHVFDITEKAGKAELGTGDINKLKKAAGYFKAARDAFKSRAMDDPSLGSSVEESGQNAYHNAAKEDMKDVSDQHDLISRIESYIHDIDTHKGVNINSEERYKEFEACHKFFMKGKEVMDKLEL